MRIASAISRFATREEGAKKPGHGQVGGSGRSAGFAATVSRQRLSPNPSPRRSETRLRRASWLPPGATRGSRRLQLRVSAGLESQPPGRDSHRLRLWGKHRTAVCARSRPLPSGAEGTPTGVALTCQTSTAVTTMIAPPGALSSRDRAGGAPREDPAMRALAGPAGAFVSVAREFDSRAGPGRLDGQVYSSTFTILRRGLSPLASALV